MSTYNPLYSENEEDASESQTGGKDPFKGAGEAHSSCKNEQENSCVEITPKLQSSVSSSKSTFSPQDVSSEVTCRNLQSSSPGLPLSNLVDEKNPVGKDASFDLHLSETSSVASKVSDEEKNKSSSHSNLNLFNGNSLASESHPLLARLSLTGDVSFPLIDQDSDEDEICVPSDAKSRCNTVEDPENTESLSDKTLMCNNSTNKNPESNINVDDPSSRVDQLSSENNFISPAGQEFSDCDNLRHDSIVPVKEVANVMMPSDVSASDLPLNAHNSHMSPSNSLPITSDPLVNIQEPMSAPDLLQNPSDPLVNSFEPLPNASDPLLDTNETNETQNNANTEQRSGSTGYDQNLVDLSLTPHLYALLLASMTQRRHSRSCCPHLFERAAPSWWNPRFDSDILEDEYHRSSIATLRLRLRYCLGYTMLACVVWVVYWVASRAPHRSYTITAAAVLALIMLVSFAFTMSSHYKRHHVPLSLLVAVVLLGSSLLPYALHTPAQEMCTDLSSPAVMAITVQVLLMVYTLVPLPLYITVLLCCGYSLLCELLNALLTIDNSPDLILVRCLLHLATHTVAGHIMLMTQVRMRGTFLSMGQSLLVRQELEREKAVKEAMIHSVMPPKVAYWLLHDHEDIGTFNEKKKSFDGKKKAFFDGKKIEISSARKKLATPRSSQTGTDLKSMVFRPFNMNNMDNVSILFADIVGFTRMSSNKTAEQLVGLLNDLFGRFDDLCVQHNCEKISTLGDCYYAVSGCPAPRPDHAVCCVDMGLSMITAIAEFDEDTNEDVDMRVGVHTGKILCGIVGTKCFKFDVWSNDVSYANHLESSGRPGQVHISEATLSFLPRNEYHVIPGPDTHDRKTYFITGHRSNSLSGSPLPTLEDESELDVKASSLPNILECSSLAGPPESSLSQTSSRRGKKRSKMDVGELAGKVDGIWSSGKWRRSFTPALDLTKFRLPRMTRSSDKGKNKTSSLPKISSKPECSTTEKVHPDGFYSARESSACSLNNDSTLTGQPTADTHNRLEPRAMSQPANGRSKPAASGVQSLPIQSPTFQKSADKPALSSAPSVPVLTHEPSNSKPSKPTLTGKLSLRCQSPANQPVDTLLVPQSAPACVSRDPWNSNPSKDPRKDSGIRSHGSSGQLSVAEAVEHFSGVLDESSNYDPMAPMHSNLTRYHQMRKQSDLRLIQCVQQEKLTKRATFTYDYDRDPPFSKVSLRFLDKTVEKMYRQQAHQPRPNEAKTLASSLYNTYFDILVSFVVHIALVVSVMVLYPPSVLWLVVLGVALLWQIALLALSQVQLLRRSSTPEQQQQQQLQLLHQATYPDQERMRPSFAECGGMETFGPQMKPHSLSHTIYAKVTQWNTWHFCGGILLSLPLATVLANFSCSSLSEDSESLRYFCYLSFVGIIHFCNFVQLNCWMKNLLVTAGGGVLITLLALPLCSCPFAASSNVSTPGNTSVSFLANFSAVPSLFNFETTTVSAHTILHPSLANVTVGSESLVHTSCTEEIHYFHVEIIVAIVLLLVLVWLLNREFEISYRLSFHGWAQALLDRSRVQAMKDQAEWMLDNIIPKHVANKIKTSNAKYSENHKRVAVMFASIVNFNEFYDESFCGGKECLRYLNELVGDFDELLGHPNFENVIKIKTIGSTYMAASGLNPDVRSKNPDPDHHIFELVEFARELQKGINQFNKDLLGFNFILRIGLNFGDVTAGVIGTTKLYYDIWGDAVNIASRMDSTGVKGRIQVTEECAQVLRRKYKVQSRGQVFVKGKDDMNVYLVEDDPSNGV
ncbi:Adenylyl cyclase class-3/4/guanylyl cyclase [Trinorchestia longiramus]|nr:Adenylyl cyclase class-3/4/guanylyl cyclase [Trinorchestia longiramus]